MYDPEAESKLIAQTLRRCADQIPPERRLKVRGATRDVLGLRKPELLGAISDWRADRSEIKGQELLGTCRHLWFGRTREEQMFSTRLLARGDTGLDTQPWEEILRWLDEVDSVEAADAAAIYLVAPWALHDLPARLSALRTLLGPRDLMWRRVALVATTGLRKCEGYPELVKEFCQSVVFDCELLVVDGVVWALCALSRQNRSAVESILQTLTELHPLAREQVDNWLRTGSRRGLVPQEWRMPGRAATTNLAPRDPIGMTGEPGQPQAGIG